MIDCSKEILAYHNKKVRLSDKDAKAMESRQGSIRAQLKKGLELKRFPKPQMEVQGGFAMKTVIQNEKHEYDLDDGVYFHVKSLNRASKGSEMSPRCSRRLVRDAVKCEKPFLKCEARSKCVRVYFKKGCHIDMPVYRLVRNKSNKGTDLVSQIAINNGWKRSDAREVTNWFEKKNKERSRGTPGGDQMRRIVRLMKKFCKSRKMWKHKMLGGFAITVLVVNCYKPNSKREDKALYNTMKAVQKRLKQNRAIKNPATPGQKIVDDITDEKAQFLLEKLTDAINHLGPLFDAKCTRPNALKCWGKILGEDFPGRRNQNKVKPGKRR